MEQKDAFRVMESQRIYRKGGSACQCV
jgi:hypothetical protein